MAAVTTAGVEGERRLRLVFAAFLERARKKKRNLNAIRLSQVKDATQLAPVNTR